MAKYVEGNFDEVRGFAALPPLLAGGAGGGGVTPRAGRGRKSNPHTQDYIQTLGVNFMEKRISLGGQEVTVRRPGVVDGPSIVHELASFRIACHLSSRAEHACADPDAQFSIWDLGGQREFANARLLRFKGAIVHIPAA